MERGGGRGGVRSQEVDRNAHRLPPGEDRRDVFEQGRVSRLNEDDAFNPHLPKASRRRKVRDEGNRPVVELPSPHERLAAVASRVEENGRRSFRR